MVAAFTPLLDNKGHQFNGTSSRPLEEPCQEGTEHRHMRSWLTGLAGGKHKRVLIGFGQCNGDASVVATMHNVVVHPEFKGLGIGSTIVERLLEQVARLGICEVGAIVPLHLEDYFVLRGFGDDPESALPMTYKKHKNGLTFSPPQVTPTLHHLLLQESSKLEGRL